MKRHWSDITTKTNTNNKRIKLNSTENSATMEISSETSTIAKSENIDDESKDDIKTNNNTIIADKTQQPLLSFKNKTILAPMVRCGTFPLRLMALKYGADIVYNQEFIDHKVIRFIRKPNNKYSCIDFIDNSNNRRVFRTFPDEKIVFQMGSSDAVRCLKACNIIGRDCQGIDLNMGCPKKFSMLGGMGAALLSKPETVEDIIKTLKRNVRNNFSVTCKIRLLKDEKLTFELCKRLEKLDINALCIHARYISDRPSCVARIKLIKPITEMLNIPCIYNGDIYKYNDICIAKELSGCESVMIGRGAQWNISVFDKNGKMERLDRIVKEYVSIGEKYANVFQNTKYVMVKMICGRRWICKSDVVMTKFRKTKHWNDCYDAIELLTNALDEREMKVKNEDPCIYTYPSVFTTDL
eukprot:261651_1